MIAAWRAWAERLDHHEDGLSLALVRIAAGLIVLTHLGRLLLAGVVPLVWYDAEHGGLRDLAHPWVLALGGATPPVVHTLIAALALSALALTLGLATRPAAFLTWLGYRTLGDLNNHAGGSYDELIINVLFLLVLARSGQRWSVDAWWRGRSGLVPAWPRWLMVFQLVVVYCSTGLQKVSNHWVPWGDLDALWYILQQPTWHHFDMAWLAPLYPLTRLATLGTWVFEVGSPVILLAAWFRATRERPGRLRAWCNRVDLRGLWLTAGFFMHLGIEATMEVGPFSLIALTLYLACYSPDEWRAWGGRLLRR